LPEPPDPDREFLAGRYRVDGLLGRGGMSEVYHGYDERLDRRVAIKVLRPPAEDEARQMLQTRFVIAQLLAAEGYPDEALAELRQVRPLLVEAFGENSTQVRNLDKQADRLRTPRS
jgi:serine/threonine protein kinase